MYPHKFHVSLGIPAFVEQYQGLEVGSKYVCMLVSSEEWVGAKRYASPCYPFTHYT